MARKTGKQLRKEYRDILDKTKAMQKRLIKRAEELIPQYPDVVYITNTFPDGKPLTVGQYKKSYRIDPMIALSIIETIEAHIASQHLHQQGDLFEVSESYFIEYHDDGDGYVPPERKIENEVLKIRLYCSHENCMTYIKGQEGYNGAFHAETGQYCDLRNQGFMCKKHN